MNIIKCKSINIPDIEYGFSTRLGGRSTGHWQSLNCSKFVGDKIENVFHNRRIFLNKLKLVDTIQLNQIHGNQVINADQITNFSTDFKADAIISSKKELSLSITTADCAPILFACSEYKIIGAVHAGWRGALSGITDNIIDEFFKYGSSPRNIFSLIGPCIGPKSYEVDRMFFINAIKSDIKSKNFFKNKNGNKFLFDLPGYLVKKIKLKGIENVFWTGHDTYANPSLFFSHRYSSKFGNGKTGRMMSVISLK